jgi:CBS-domain-containing membrane protein
MITTSKPFRMLTAADLMSRDVLTIPRHITLRAAAQMLSRARVSGAPVVDHRNRCIGVLSATDFIRWAEGGEKGASNCVCSDWQMMDFDLLPAEEVANHMTTDLVTGTMSTGVTELARMMLDAHIHRIIIVDQLARPIGIVTATDVLAAVARGEGEEV